MKNQSIKEYFSVRMGEVNFLLLILLISFQPQCTTQKVSRELVEVENAKQLNPKREYLKVHLNNGELYVLNDWKFEETRRFIEGTGTHLDANRRPTVKRRGDYPSASPRTKLELQKFRIPYDDIIIVETNDKGKNPGVATMVVTSVLTVPLAIACLINPKSCFGSCPTFYVNDRDGEKLVAEGFSSSISKSLEEIDVDMLNVSFSPGPVEITMKNEALETHMVKSISLLVCDKKPGNKVFAATDGKFYEVDQIVIPKKASYLGTSILDKISHRDDVEWFSLADSSDLATKEEVFFEFENFPGSNGLVIDKRQSLMTTCLFYQMLALSGSSTSYLIGEMETAKPKYQKRISKMYELLGGIEVSIQDEKGSWEVVDELTESGPIALDMHLMKLPVLSSEKLNVRLRFTKGLWRINMVNLAQIAGEVIPKRVFPDKVLTENLSDTVTLNKLNDKTQYLVTYPGDKYRIRFPIESLSSQEYFLESEGYYIEWMREEWLKEENWARTKMAMLFPSSYLKKTAPFYKLNETEMESIFWSSKYSKVENPIKP